MLFRSEITTWCHRTSNHIILTWGHLIEPTLGHLIEPTKGLLVKPTCGRCAKWRGPTKKTIRGANEQAHVDPTLDQRMHVVWENAYDAYYHNTSHNIQNRVYGRMIMSKTKLNWNYCFIALKKRNQSIQN